MSADVIALRADALAELRRRGLRVPSYDRRRLVPRVVHIGVGGFHRAHLALYLDHLAERGSDWGVCGIGLLGHDRAMADVLAAQDHLYTFTAKGPSARESEVVGSIVDYVYAADDTTRAVERIAHPDTAIVSMTVTEAGYDDSERSRRTFDVIADGLARRRAGPGTPLTILSCDNLPGNGTAARRCLLAAADRRAPGLAAWAEQRCAFPNSMVDRITPVTTDADRDHLRAAYGMIDRWPVVGEPFWQWVLEDRFAAGRPDLSAAGVLYTDDVHAWELYKLRLLNAGHSSIAYLSALAGITFVDEALATPPIREFLSRLLLGEAVPVLDAIPGHPPEDYAEAVIDRFANPGVRDQIARLCIDGTAKFPTFLMPTIGGQLARGGPVAHAALALAGWAHYLASVPVDQQAHDAAGDRTRRRARAAVADPPAFLVDNAAFPPEVAASPRFIDAFTDAHRSIARHGALSAIAALVGAR